MKENISLIVGIIALLIAIAAFSTGFLIQPELKIDAGQIDESELADDVVTGSKIKEGEVTDEHISEDGISKIAENSINGLHIINGSVTLAKLNQEVLDAMNGVDIVNNSITNSKIADDAITSDKIEAGSIGTDELEDASVTNDKLASGAVTWNDVSGKPIEVFAAGYIKSDTSVEYGYNVNSVTYDGITKFYTIYTNGYVFGDNYVTLITHYSGSAYEDVAHSAYGPTIWLHDKDGNYVQSDFYFVTYKII